MIIKILADGGDMKPGPNLAKNLGPLGINMGKVISEINEKTKEFKGMKVPVELDINEKTKEFQVKVFSPPTAELLKKEFNLEKGSPDHKNIKVGNASIEDVIKIAKIKLPNMLEKDLKTAVKTVLGTCMSIGLLVENKEPKEVVKEVEQGKYDKEINEEKTETSPEKRQKLEEFFKQIESKQSSQIKQTEGNEEKKK